jgi:hypothetical protein
MDSFFGPRVVLVEPPLRRPWLPLRAAVLGLGLAPAALLAQLNGQAAGRSGGAPTAPPVTPMPTRTPVPNRFIQAEATWSGLGDVNLRVLNPSGVEVGQRLPSNCESTARRTERVVAQRSLPSGTYRVTLEGLPCGSGTPPSITAILTVSTETGTVSACAGALRNVPVGGVVDCSFELP